MQKVLILGAGLISRPVVRYLLELGGVQVTQASRTVGKAEAMIEAHPDGRAIALDMDEPGAETALDRMVAETDLAVSLLPYTHHVRVAEACLRHRVHLVTTSYVSEAMADLDGAARERGILILNECGLDPGIDHMSAMRVIHDVETRGGRILSFRSTTGALPSHEANTNPLGYKFSWSPRGVLLASRNAATWLENGSVTTVPGSRLFEHYRFQDVPGVGTFENYPNRDALPYRDLYGLGEARTVYRGTFRMAGWCETLRCIAALGWLETEPVEGFSGNTYGDLTRHRVGAAPEDDLAEATARFLGFPLYAAALKRLEWLGLLGDEVLPAGTTDPLTWLNTLLLRRLPMDSTERDMVVMVHEFHAALPDGRRERITATLLDYGQPGGDTSVARTVALPAAIAARLILEGRIGERGVRIPVEPEFYVPILEELERLGIRFSEHREGA